jgi:hypothetical protein
MSALWIGGGGHSSERRADVGWQGEIDRFHLMKNLVNPNIVRCYGGWRDEKTGEINFITELFTSGTPAGFVVASPTARPSVHLIGCVPSVREQRAVYDTGRGHAGVAQVYTCGYVALLVSVSMANMPGSRGGRAGQGVPSTTRHAA